MIIVGLTDIHGSVAALERANDALARADVVLLVGDITNFGRDAEAARVVSPVVQHAARVLAVSGNCDFDEVDVFLDQQGLNLHGKGREIDGIGFVGLGGSLITPFKTPNELTEDEIEQSLDQGLAQLPPGIPLVLVSHQPPYQTRCDRLLSGDYVGSLAVREFIEKTNPMVCFTGHIHESTGIDRVGETYVINPGMLRRGQYAYAEINNGVEAVEIRSLP